VLLLVTAMPVSPRREIACVAVCVAACVEACDHNECSVRDGDASVSHESIAAWSAFRDCNTEFVNIMCEFVSVYFLPRVLEV